MSMHVNRSTKGLQFLQHNLYLMQYFSLEKVRLVTLYDVIVRLYVIHFNFKANKLLACRCSMYSYKLSSHELFN